MMGNVKTNNRSQSVKGKCTKLVQSSEGYNSVAYSQKQAPVQTDEADFDVLLDPGLIRSARSIYTTYYEVHPELIQRPLGVAISVMLTLAVLISSELT